MEDRNRLLAERLVDSLVLEHTTGQLPGDQLQARKTRSEENTKNLNETSAWESLSHVDSIRFLRLEPSEDASTELRGCLLSGRLSSQLSECPHYEAISYNWGEVRNHGTLHLKCGRVLGTAQNLDSALRAFRLKDKARLLWIDAVCIDQESLGEKAQQVAMMSRIFQSAATVLCWLGPAINRTATLFEFLENKAAKATEYGLDDFEETTPWKLKMRPLNCSKSEAEWIYEEAVDLRVANVFERKYFTRLWVCQEVALGTLVTINVGPCSMPLERFITAFFVVLGAGEMLDVNMSWARRAWSIMALRTRVKFHGLPGALVLSPYRAFGAEMRAILDHECEDDRDRVFALIGLKPPDCNIEIVPDYTKTVSEVYIDFAREFLRYDVYVLFDAGMCHRGTLEYDETAQINTGSGEGHLPSWVPDYRLQKSALATFPWNFNHFSTATDIPTHVTTSPDKPHQICVRGFLFDTVESITGLRHLDSHTQTLSPSITSQFIGSWLEILATQARLRGHEQPPEDGITDFANALLLGGNSEELNEAMPHSAEIELEIERRLPYFLKYYVLSNEPLPDGEPNQPGALDDEQSYMATAREFHKCLEIMLAKYRLAFMMTEEHGEFGWAPHETKQNDMVAIFDGAPMPFILRPIQAPTDDENIIVTEFQLVGPCYIEGLMMNETTKSDLFNDRWGMIPIV